MNKHIVFVYGSLRRGNAHSMSVRFPNAKLISAAKASGSLYDLGAYPGLVSDGSNSLVIGELYEVDDELLSELDEFEATSNYLRKQIEISIGTNKSTCWVYEPNPDHYSFHTLITSGDWIEFARTKTDWQGKIPGPRRGA